MTGFDSAVLVYILLASGGHPASTPHPGQERTVAFACENHAKLTVSFGDGTAVLVDPHGRAFHLKQQISGSGIAYEGDGQRLRGKGQEMTWTTTGQNPVVCTAGQLTPTRLSQAASTSRHRPPG
jgi:membrane-bound inhibitor of C-type lysozyme